MGNKASTCCVWGKQAARLLSSTTSLARSGALECGASCPRVPHCLQEWRHLNGMKALGIPNSKQFFEVTTIADALALWKNLQEREKGEAAWAAGGRGSRAHEGKQAGLCSPQPLPAGVALPPASACAWVHWPQVRWPRLAPPRPAGGFRPEADEEFEDAQGNVYSKKTYEDLKRQGLI